MPFGSSNCFGNPLSPHLSEVGFGGLCMADSVTFWKRQSDIHIHFMQWLPSCFCFVFVFFCNVYSLGKVKYVCVSVAAHKITCNMYVLCNISCWSIDNIFHIFELEATSLCHYKLICHIQCPSNVLNVGPWETRLRQCLPLLSLRSNQQIILLYFWDIGDNLTEIWLNPLQKIEPWSLLLSGVSCWVPVMLYKHIGFCWWASGPLMKIRQSLKCL